MKADKLIDDANELLMQLRIKSEKERINEKQLYDVQMLLYKALDKLRQPTVIKSVCRCKEGKQGRTVDENWEQICDVCGGS